MSPDYVFYRELAVFKTHVCDCSQMHRSHTACLNALPSWNYIIYVPFVCPDRHT